MAEFLIFIAVKIKIKVLRKLFIVKTRGLLFAPCDILFQYKSVISALIFP